MAREPEERGHFISSDQPSCPIAAKVEWGEKHGHERISEERANELSAALRVKDREAAVVEPGTEARDEHERTGVARKPAPPPLPEVVLLKHISALERRIEELEARPMPQTNLPAVIQEYDDAWLREQMQEFAHAIAGNAYDDSDIVRRLDALEAGSENNTLNFRVVEPPPVTPATPNTSWLRNALDRAAVADASEADTPIEELPPIEIEEAVPIDQPEVLKAPEPAPEPEPRIIERVIERDGAIDDQIIYEVAMRAINGSAQSLQQLKPAADMRGLTCKQLAEQIVKRRIERENEVMREFASKVEG